MNQNKTIRLPSGLAGSLPVSLFVEEETVNLTPQESRVREPEDSIPIQTLETVTVSESPQCTATAIPGQKENPLILNALPSGGMKSPCTSTPSVYNTFETAEQRDEWLEAIARDDLHDERLFLNAAARGELRDPAFDEMLDEQERDCEAQRIKDLEEV